MKVLIIEDNPRKLQDTIDYVNDVSKEEVEIEVAYSVTEGRRMLKETLYDRVIIDMQLPSTRNSSIDRFGGITILKYLPMTINVNTRHIVNSSSSETREVLDNNNFPLVGLIVNSTMYDCTKQFDVFINGLKFVEPVGDISLTSPITMEDYLLTQAELGGVVAAVFGVDLANGDDASIVPDFAKPYVKMGEAMNAVMNKNTEPYTTSESIVDSYVDMGIAPNANTDGDE